MGYKLLTGNEVFAKGTQRAAAQRGSRVIPVYFNPAVDEMSIAIYDGDELIKGPYPITPTWGADIKKVADALGWMPFQTQEPPAPPVTPPSKKPAKVAPPARPPLTLESVTKEILGLQKRTVHNYIEIGRWLHEAKKLAGHGNWLPYLKNEVHLSEWVAQACMRMSADYGSNPGHVEDLTFSELVSILNAPVEARPALIELAKTASVGAVREAVREANRSIEVIVAPPPLSGEVVIIHLADEPVVIPTYTDSADPIPPTVTEPPLPEPVAESPTPELVPDPAPPEVIVPPSQPVALVEVAIEVRTVEPVQAPPFKEEPQPDPLAPLKEKGLQVDMAMTAIFDVLNRTRQTIEPLDAKIFGDYIDLDLLYRTSDTLELFRGFLQRIAADSARQKGE